MNMKLMTAEVEEALEKNKLYSHDGEGGDTKVIVKYFGGSAATWLITEGERRGNDWLLYGYVTLGLPDFDGNLIWEWGYVMLSELEQLRFPPFGLGTERDITVKPGNYKVRDLTFMCSQYGSDSKKGSYDKKKEYKPLIDLRKR